MKHATIRFAIAAALILCLAASSAWAAEKKSSKKSTATKAKAAPAKKAYNGVARDPYIGAIVVDAATGQVLYEENADGRGYPASVIKLMDLLIVLERIEQGKNRLDEVVTASAAASRTGGSQVYLKEKETFAIEDLLYALIIQSANDSAVALAEHVGGSKDGFVTLMNQKAQELGMTNTTFHSVHGLPPAPGSGTPFDASTARDLSKLCMELVKKHPAALTYSSTKERAFRNGSFVMRTHNHLLGELAGCDGLKTGFIAAGGYSIAVTAQREGRRVIAVVLGSRDRLVRDARAKELVNKGFAALPPLPPPAPAMPVVTNTPPPVPAPVEAPASAKTASPLVVGLSITVVVLLAFIIYLASQRSGRRME